MIVKVTRMPLCLPDLNYGSLALYLAAGFLVMGADLRYKGKNILKVRRVLRSQKVLLAVTFGFALLKWARMESLTRQ